MENDTPNPTSRKRRLLEKTWEIIKAESAAIVLIGAIFAGAAASALLISDVTGIALRQWWLLALAVAIMNLPRSFAKNKNRRPYTIRLACGFGDGFMPMGNILQWLLEFWSRFHSNGK